MALRRLAPYIFLFVIAILASGCVGPRTKWLVKDKPAPLPADTKVDVYVGKIDPPYLPIAIIETDASKLENQDVRKAQYDELCAKARKVGANAIQDVKILNKRVKGVTPDERTPFKSWQQGRYNLYFMRGMAISVPERPSPALTEAEPPEGWAVSKLPVPPELPK